MERKRDRIIIDTNLWVSFILTASHVKLDKIFSDSSIVLLFSEELLDEFIEVASRPKFKKYFSMDDLKALLGQIENKSEFIIVSSEVKVCRDAKDNFLLALSKDGKATHLISGDKDLTSIGSFEGTEIVTITEYLAGR